MLPDLVRTSSTLGLLVGAALAGLAGVAVAQSTTWTGAGGTDFALSGNWDNGAPGPTDAAVINLTGNQPIVGA